MVIQIHIRRLVCQLAVITMHRTAGSPSLHRKCRPWSNFLLKGGWLVWSSSDRLKTIQVGASQDRSRIIQKSQSSSRCATVSQKSHLPYSSLPVSSTIIPTAFTLFNHSAAFLTARLNCVLFRKEWQKSIFINLHFPLQEGQQRITDNDNNFFSISIPTQQQEKARLNFRLIL